MFWTLFDSYLKALRLASEAHVGVSTPNSATVMPPSPVASLKGPHNTPGCHETPSPPRLRITDLIQGSPFIASIEISFYL